MSPVRSDPVLNKVGAVSVTTVSAGQMTHVNQFGRQVYSDALAPSALTPGEGTLPSDTFATQPWICPETKNHIEQLHCYDRFNKIDQMKIQNWLLLTYKVPPEPAKKRIALWRRLKGMGAVYLQNGVCLLPHTDDHTRRLKIIENEIDEMAGESVLLETVALDRTQEEKVVARFKADRDDEYEEFLDKCKDFEAEIAKETAANHFTYAELEENDVDLKKLYSWLEKIGKLDFYGAPLAEEARKRLLGCEALLDAYAQKVFEAHDENR